MGPSACRRHYGKKNSPLLPHTAQLLLQLGERLRLSRLRRRITAKQVAERAGMTPVTLRSLERGGSGVTMGAYLAVMQVLGVEQDLQLLVREDPLGRELQDARLPRNAGSRDALEARSQKRSPRPKENAAAKPSAQGRSMPLNKIATRKGVAGKRPAGAESWLEDSEFTSSDGLAKLLTPAAPAAAKPTKKRR